MNLYPITTIDDPRLAAYRALKDREVAREGDRFIAEGKHLVRRLLDSDFPVESVFLAENQVDEIAPLVPADVPVYVAAKPLMREVIGFKFHSGVIACGWRKPRPSLEAVLPPDKPRLTAVICPEIANAENLGSLIRISAAFGVDAMLLGERSCDPFWRQSIRVSMGAVFRLPILHSDDLERDLRRLRDQWGMEMAATVLDTDAEPLAGAKRPDRFGLMFGNEAQGLGARWTHLADRHVTIPMHHGTDSLNVAIAAAVCLYHFTSCGSPTGEPAI